MTRKKLATVWLAGCSGCHMSLLDMDERILEIAKLADFVKSPIVDGKELGEVDITLVEGGLAMDEHVEEILHIRKHSKLVVSFGDCAITGNVPTMRNMLSKDSVLRQSYVTAPSNDNPDQVIPRFDIGRLNDRVTPLHEMIKVDYVIPGCPPSADLIFYVLTELLNGRKPSIEKGRLRNG